MNGADTARGVDSDEDFADEGSRRIGPKVAIPLLVVLVAFIGVLATRDDAPARGSYSALIGRPVPAIVGPTLDEDTFELPAVPGKYVVVNFFATWCVPCIREHPELVNFARRHDAVGDAMVVSVLYDTRTDQAREFFADNGGDWPVVVDEDGHIALTFGVSGVPESYLVDPRGRVLVKLVGGITAAQLDVLIAEAETMAGR